MHSVESRWVCALFACVAYWWPLRANMTSSIKPEAVAPPGFCNSEVRYGSIRGLEYEVPQSRLYCLCINVALCSTALQCICRVLRRSSRTMKAHTYYIIFGRPPIGGSFPPSPQTAPLSLCECVNMTRTTRQRQQSTYTHRYSTAESQVKKQNERTTR